MKREMTKTEIQDLLSLAAAHWVWLEFDNGKPEPTPAEWPAWLDDLNKKAGSS